MSGIQLILLTGVAFIGLFFFIRLKKRTLDILLLFFMVGCAAVFVIWPDITNKIATRLGVGRGADLVFYISILTFWFVILKLYARIRRLEQLLTEIVREDALNKASAQAGKSDTL